MQIIYEPALIEYLRQKDMCAIAVEVVSSQNSDFEVTELYLHPMREKQAAYFKQKKRYRAVPAPVGEVLLPPYRLEYDEAITFGLKKFWIFHSVRQTGIRL